MNSRLQPKGKLADSSWGKVLKRGFKSMGMRARNKRRFHRYDCAFPVEVHFDSPGQVSVVEAEARNISSGGMLLKCSTVIESFTHCHVSFQLPEWFPCAAASSDVMTAAKVLHASAAGLTFGIAFNHPL